LKLVLWLVQAAGLVVPALVMHADRFQWEANRWCEDELCSNAKAEALQLRFNDTGHVNFSDFALFAPEVRD
jgi:hypothetical protein